MGSAVGNDVVDLTRAEARGKARDERFVRRVFTAAEAAWIRSAPDPDRALWTLWAAKEAAFKVVSKLDGGAVFAHRSYEVEPPPHALVVPWTAGVRAPATAGAAARVRAALKVHGERGRDIAVEWELSERLVHCLAVSDESCFSAMRAAVGVVDPSGSPPAEWTQRERQSARTAESCEARMLAKRLACEAGLGAVEVVRNPGARRAGPPLLYPPGGSSPMAGWDVTLSHDGEFAAAALCAV